MLLKGFAPKLTLMGLRKKKAMVVGISCNQQVKITRYDITIGNDD